MSSFSNRLRYGLLIVVTICTYTVNCQAQQMDTGSIFQAPMQLDSVTIRIGFDVQAFIRRVRTDTTFYKAFRSMHFVPFSAVNNIAAFDKNGAAIASYHSKTKQTISKHCRTTAAQDESTTGDFYKRDGSYNYYTAALYDHLFFAKAPVCNESEVVAEVFATQGSGPMAKSEYQLKQLIFNPGAKVSGIPFMGDRASLFEPGGARNYDFSIAQEPYGDTTCYVFRIKPKAGREQQALFNELTTWFRKGDYSIMARNYSLAYHTLVYDFDVKMKVRTIQKDGKLYPTYIDYDGNWHVFTKKRERVKFTILISY